MSTIGSLSVDFQADTNVFSVKVLNAGKTLAGFGVNVVKTSAVIVGNLTPALVVVNKEVTDLATRLVKLRAKIIAVSVAAAAATTAGIIFLSKKMSDAVRQTERYSIELNRSIEEIKGLELASRLTGKTIQDLDRSISAIKLTKFIDEAKRLGLVLDKDARKSLENLRISSERAKLSFGGLGRAIAVASSGPLTLFFNVITIVNTNISRVVRGIGDFIGSVIKLGFALNSLRPGVLAFKFIFLGLRIAVVLVDKAFKLLSFGAESIASKISAAADAINKFGENIINFITGGLLDRINDLSESLDTTRISAEKVAEATAKIGRFTGPTAVQLFENRLKALKIAFDNNKLSLEQFRRGLKNVSAEFKRTDPVISRGRRIMEAFKTPIERVRDRFRELRDSFAEGGVTLKEFRKGASALGKELEKLRASEKRRLAGVSGREIDLRRVFIPALAERQATVQTTNDPQIQETNTLLEQILRRTGSQNLGVT